MVLRLEMLAVSKCSKLSLSQKFRHQSLVVDHLRYEDHRQVLREERLREHSLQRKLSHLSSSQNLCSLRNKKLSLNKFRLQQAEGYPQGQELEECHRDHL